MKPEELKDLPMWQASIINGKNLYDTPPASDDEFEEKKYAAHSKADVDETATACATSDEPTQEFIINEFLAKIAAAAKFDITPFAHKSPKQILKRIAHHLASNKMEGLVKQANEILAKRLADSTQIFADNQPEFSVRSMRSLFGCEKTLVDSEAATATAEIATVTATATATEKAKVDSKIFKVAYKKPKYNGENLAQTIALRQGYYCIGDLHSDLDSLTDLILKIVQIEKGDFKKPIVFNGDFIDRGYCPYEVLALLMLLLKEYPDFIFLQKGNHELNVEEGVKSQIADCDREKFKTICNQLPIITMLVSPKDAVFIDHGALPHNGGQIMNLTRLLCTSEWYFLWNDWQWPQELVKEDLLTCWYRTDVIQKEGEISGRGVKIVGDCARRILHENNVTKIHGSHAHANQDLDEHCQLGLPGVMLVNSSGAGSVDITNGHVTAFPKMLKGEIDPTTGSLDVSYVATNAVERAEQMLKELRCYDPSSLSKLKELDGVTIDDIATLKAFVDMFIVLQLNPNRILCRQINEQWQILAIWAAEQVYNILKARDLKVDIDEEDVLKIASLVEEIRYFSLTSDTKVEFGKILSVKCNEMLDDPFYSRYKLSLNGLLSAINIGQEQIVYNKFCVFSNLDDDEIIRCMESDGLESIVDAKSLINLFMYFADEKNPLRLERGFFGAHSLIFCCCMGPSYGNTAPYQALIRLIRQRAQELLAREAYAGDVECLKLQELSAVQCDRTNNRSKVQELAKDWDPSFGLSDADYDGYVELKDDPDANVRKVEMARI